MNIIVNRLRIESVKPLIIVGKAIEMISLPKDSFINFSQKHGYSSQIINSQDLLRPVCLRVF